VVITTESFLASARGSKNPGVRRGFLWAVGLAQACPQARIIAKLVAA